MQCALELPMCNRYMQCVKKFLKSCNFNPHSKVHKFREGSPESLYLTGTPSGNVLKIFKWICAGNPSHRIISSEFPKRSLYSRTSVGTPTTVLSLFETSLCDSFLLSSEYSKSSRDLRVQSEIPN